MFDVYGLEDCYGKCLNPSKTARDDFLYKALNVLILLGRPMVIKSGPY